MKPILPLAAFFFAASVCAADPITVVDPYVRLAPPGSRTTAAFMVVKNASDKAVALVKAESPVAGVTELHTHLNDGGVMRMRQVKEIPVPAKGEAVLAPGGYHVMLIDLKAPLKEGDKVAITLGFADGGAKTIEAPVRKPQPQMHGH
ncbi:MAG: copper chaperone PCu(A)C [Rhodocyclaceae bacterium]|nr:copper chaperone PCu(A)C [Rhodocyclaceae bacterium]